MLHCSDYVKTHICSGCGSLLAPTFVPSSKTKADTSKRTVAETYECTACGPDAKLVLTDMPYVIKYLNAELACMNVKMDFKFKTKDVQQDCLLKEL